MDIATTQLEQPAARNSSWVYPGGIWLASISISALFPAVPFMMMDLSTNPLAVALASSAFSVGGLLFTLGAGTASDRYGFRLTVTLLIVVATVAGGMIPLATTVTVLLILRFLSAAAVGLEAVVLSAVSAASEKPDTRALGAVATAKAIGFKLGPLMAAMIGLYVVAPHLRFLWISCCASGALLLALPLFLVGYGAAANRPANLPMGRLFQGLHRIEGLDALLLLRIAMGIANGISLPVGALFAARKFGWTVVEFGFLLSGITIVLVAVRIVFTRKAHLERHERSSVTVSLGLYALSMLVAQAANSPAVFVLAYLGTAVANAVLPVVTTVIASRLGPDGQRGTVMGISGAAFFVGELAGAPIGGALFTVGAGVPFLALAFSQLFVAALCWRKLRDN